MKKQPLTKSPELAEVQMTYKTKVKPSAMPKITCSGDIATNLRTIWGDDLEYREEFFVLMLNRANRLIGWVRLSSGGISGTVADPKMIFQAALLANASAIILAHNHPSGELKASAADIALTKKVRDAGKVLDIAVLDHIIMTSEAYTSFADDGLL